MLRAASGLAHAAILLVDTQALLSEARAPATLTVNLIQTTAPATDDRHPQAQVADQPRTQKFTSTAPDTEHVNDDNPATQTIDPPAPVVDISTPPATGADAKPAQAVAATDAAAPPASAKKHSPAAVQEAQTVSDEVAASAEPELQVVTAAVKTDLEAVTESKPAPAVKTPTVEPVEVVVEQVTAVSATPPARVMAPVAIPAEPDPSTTHIDSIQRPEVELDTNSNDTPDEEADTEDLDEFNSTDTVMALVEDVAAPAARRSENEDTAPLTMGAEPASAHSSRAAPDAEQPHVADTYEVSRAAENLAATQTQTEAATPVDESAIRQQIRARFDHDLVYPMLARKRGWEGNVDVMLRVSAGGHIEVLSVMRSSGFGVLDRYTRKALEHIRLDQRTLENLNGGHHDLRIEVKYQLLTSRG